jgi:catechol 2,3-dioxygenase-like lactoylglutathione lyase family enzyme
MYYGWPSLCLNVQDLDRATRFYESIGMEVLPEASSPGKRVVLRSGTFRLGLFLGIGSNCLNLRGGDVTAVHQELKGRFPDLEGEPERYVPDPVNGADAAGCCWFTKDPDGNSILFDTNEREEGDSFRRWRTEQILRDAERELAAVADADVVETFRTQLIDRFCR